MAWGITAVFSVSFQCPSPRRWDVINEKCINIQSMKTYNAVMNILTDAALLIIPSIIILSVQASSEVRMKILVGFLFRGFVIIATIIQIIYIQHLVIDGYFIHNVWQVVIWNEVVQTASIMTACIPFLKPFLLSLESGFLRADDMNRRTAVGIGSENISSGWALRYIKMRS
ncbi:uncharacterized protein F4817DRAFT_341178 [Daldinia loculata]|uniref:uncharacterized protein n=1 Tax=Daldinia loculata TaxID=103429 RepID=UPI0020C49E78|nr:uncharacterized protein F4817DRAFT_341178 [Daldinia loculata]KAI1646301.1 hypothetical protein F4817DRAFT_341178 [Daldinia loculata]